MILTSRTISLSWEAPDETLTLALLFRLQPVSFFFPACLAISQPNPSMIIQNQVFPPLFPADTSHDAIRSYSYGPLPTFPFIRHDIRRCSGKHRYGHTKYLCVVQPDPQ